MSPESVIRSRQNPIYKQIRSLLRRDRRHEERAFLVEGPRFIADAQRFGATPLQLVFSETFAQGLDLPPGQARLARILDDELFATLTDTVASQGMIGVFPFPDLPVPHNVTPFVLVTDGIQDPGNLGTLIRSAAGAGVTRLITLPGTVDPWSPKTVRSAAAAHFVLPIASLTLSELASAIPAGASILGADAGGAMSFDDVDFTASTVLIVGSEGNGLADKTMEFVDQLVSIPLSNAVESLNAGVAGSILLFEAARQRRIAAKSVENPNV